MHFTSVLCLGDKPKTLMWFGFLKSSYNKHVLHKDCPILTDSGMTSQASMIWRKLVKMPF